MKRVIICLLPVIFFASCGWFHNISDELGFDYYNLKISGRVFIKNETGEIVPLKEEIQGICTYDCYLFGLYKTSGMIEEFTTNNLGYFDVHIPFAASNEVSISVERILGDTVRYAAGCYLTCPEPSYKVKDVELVLRYSQNRNPRIVPILPEGYEGAVSEGDSVRFIINHEKFKHVKLYTTYYPNQYAQNPDKTKEEKVFLDVNTSKSGIFSFSIPTDFDWDLYQPHNRVILLDYNTHESSSTYKHSLFFYDKDENDYVWKVKGRFVIQEDSVIVPIDTFVYSKWSYQVDAEPSIAVISENDISYEKRNIRIQSNESGEFEFTTPKGTSNYPTLVDASVNFNGEAYKILNKAVSTLKFNLYRYRSNDTIYNIVDVPEIILEKQ